MTQGGEGLLEPAFAPYVYEVTIGERAFRADSQTSASSAILPEYHASGIGLDADLIIDR